jgi:hypothetical protein
MAYSPMQMLLTAVFVGGFAAYVVFSSHRKGTVPRARPRWGKLPPEMGTAISREKEPRRFWLNIWIGVAVVGVCIFLAALSIAFMFDPSL